MRWPPKKKKSCRAEMKAVTRPVPESTPDKIPQHVAVIMDGNGRWATARGLPRALGHKKGAETLRNILTGCQKLGLKYLTIYAFSAENWKRPVIEISDLMELLRHYLDHEIASLHQNGVRLRIIGDKSKLAIDIRDQIEAAEGLTKDNRAFNLTVALSYGARQEMLQAVRALAARIQSGEASAEGVDEKLLSSLLYTHDLPDPDLLIRTGGEQRLSNFLLWQSAYAELYFTPVLWPDFSMSHLQEAIAEYASRERRYGTTGV
jgi:undecaprenyl diphosphate synthase